MFDEAILKDVAPEFHAEFRKFVETGEASNVFLDYLDNDATCQSAIDKAFANEVEAFHQISAKLGVVPEKTSRALVVGAGNRVSPMAEPSPKSASTTWISALAVGCIALSLVSIGFVVRERQHSSDLSLKLASLDRIGRPDEVGSGLAKAEPPEDFVNGGAIAGSSTARFFRAVREAQHLLPETLNDLDGADQQRQSAAIRAVAALQYTAKLSQPKVETVLKNSKNRELANVFQSWNSKSIYECLIGEAQFPNESIQNKAWRDIGLIQSPNLSEKIRALGKVKDGESPVFRVNAPTTIANYDDEKKSKEFTPRKNEAASPK